MPYLEFSQVLFLFILKSFFENLNLKLFLFILMFYLISASLFF